MFLRLFIVALIGLSSVLSANAQDTAGYPAAFPFDFMEPDEQEKLEQMLGADVINEEENQDNARYLANQFFMRCMEEGTDHRYEKDKESVCACTAAGIMEIMNEEQIAALPENSYEGLFQRERTITLAYVPCFEPVLVSNLERICNADPNFRRRYKNSAKLCSCQSQRLGAYAFPKYTNIVWEKAQMSQPLYIKDLLAEIVSQPEFTIAANSLRRQCIYQEVYKWGSID